MQIRPKLKDFYERKKEIIIPLLPLVLLAVLVFPYLSFPQFFQSRQNVKKNLKIENKTADFSSIEKGELVGTFAFAPDQKAKLGDLEITAYNIKDGSYTSFDLDKNQSRVVKKYLAVQVKVFNSSRDTNDVLLIGLEDDKKNQYDIDHSIGFFLGNMKDFGQDTNVYYRTIREGYLFFSGPPEDAKKLNLIFFSGVTNKKIIFEINR